MTDEKKNKYNIYNLFKKWSLLFFLGIIFYAFGFIVSFKISGYKTTEVPGLFLSQNE
ncbi:MAG: hypothetical protein HUU56_01700 [Bdellovibrionaceae bacterium]|nr:hypothetical protein [Pseudobdellovibrionaceae bacterium]